MYETILTEDFLKNELILKEKPKARLSIEINISIRTINKYIKKYNLSIPKPVHHTFNDLTGQQIRHWTVLERKANTKHGSATWLCRCECGKERIVRALSLMNKDSSSCGCTKNKKNFKGYENISGTFFRKLQKGASERKLDFLITIEDVWNLFITQNQKCALSGVDICFISDYNKHTLQTASVDRKNSLIGYTKENIQIVHKQINILKNTISDNELLFWAKQIYFHNQKEADSINEIKLRVRSKYKGTQTEDGRFLDDTITSNY